MLLPAEEVSGTPQFQILLRNFKAVRSAHHRVHSRFCVVAAVVGHEHAEALLAASSDASAELMELRKPELLRIFNEYHHRVWDVDTDLDNGSRNQQFELPRLEIRHDLLFFRLFQLSVEQYRRDITEISVYEPVVVLYRARLLALALGRFHQRADDVRLPPGGNVLLNEIVHPQTEASVNRVGLYREPSLRHFAQYGNVKVAVDYQRQRARYRRCGHRKDMRRFPLFGEGAAL